jgi:hypothetical protein
MHEGSELKLVSAHGVHFLRRDVRTWNGVIVSVNDMSCSPGRAWHDISPRQNRMAIVLEQIGGRVEARTKINQPSQSNWSGRDHKDAKDYEENGPKLSVFGERDHGALLQIAGGRGNALQYDISQHATSP